MSQQPDMLGHDDVRLSTAPDAALDAVPAAVWAKSLVNLIEMMEAAGARAGLDETEAFRRARFYGLVVAECAGGRQLYLPRGERLNIALRDAEIYRRARRGNIPQLATEYGVIDSQIWRIIRQQRALHIRKVQPDLFGAEP
ncbi:MAG TPA: Mor transcription activator family protein [Polyangiaceae bacterium]